MKYGHVHTAFSLLETVLFLGILAIMSGTIVAVYISTQESRVRQYAIAELEQSGTALMGTMTKNIRRAERVLAPSIGETGSLLALQMAGNSEFPTIYARSPDGNLTNVQKTSTSALLTSHVTITNLSFQNIADSTVTYSFNLTITIPTIVPQPYTRTFSSTVTLFPDDQGDAGGCGSCTAPVCTDHEYIWHSCDSGVCTQSEVTIAC